MIVKRRNNLPKFRNFSKDFQINNNLKNTSKYLIVTLLFLLTQI